MVASEPGHAFPVRRPKLCARRSDGTYVQLLYADEAPPIVGVEPSLDEATVKALGFKVLDGEVQLPNSSYTAVPPPPRAPRLRATVEDSEDSSPLDNPSTSVNQHTRHFSPTNSITSDASSHGDESGVFAARHRPMPSERGFHNHDMMNSRYASDAAERRPPSPPGYSGTAFRGPVKTHCHYYFHKDGECGYHQVGCKFSHEFPRSWPEIYAKLGLNHIPDFFKMSRPADYAALMKDLDGWEHPPWSEKANRETPPNARPAITGRSSGARLYTMPSRHAPAQLSSHAYPSRARTSFDRSSISSQYDSRGRQGAGISHHSETRNMQHVRRDSHTRGMFSDAAEDSLIELESVTGDTEDTADDARKRGSSSEHMSRGLSSSSTLASMPMDSIDSIGLGASKYASQRGSSAHSSVSPPTMAATAVVPEPVKHPKFFLDSTVLDESAAVAEVEAKNKRMMEALNKPTHSSKATAAHHNKLRNSTGPKPQNVIPGAQRLQHQLQANEANNARVRPTGSAAKGTTPLTKSTASTRSPLPSLKAEDQSLRSDKKKPHSTKVRASKKASASGASKFDAVDAHSSGDHPSDGDGPTRKYASESCETIMASGGSYDVDTKIWIGTSSGKGKDCMKFVGNDAGDVKLGSKILCEPRNA